MLLFVNFAQHDLLEGCRLDFLLSSDGSLLLAALTITITVLIAFGILWLMDKSFHTLQKFGLIGSGQPQVTPEIAERLLELARRSSFDDEINTLDLEFVKKCLERELPAKYGFQKRGMMSSMNPLLIGLPEAANHFFQEWGVLEGIGWCEWWIGVDDTADCGCGVFRIGAADESCAYVVAPSDVVFEQGYGEGAWELTPAAKTIYHFALQLCREQSDEDQDEMVESIKS